MRGPRKWIKMDQKNESKFKLVILGGWSMSFSLIRFSPFSQNKWEAPHLIRLFRVYSPGTSVRRVPKRLIFKKEMLFHNHTFPIMLRTRFMLTKKLEKRKIERIDTSSPGLKFTLIFDFFSFLCVILISKFTDASASLDFFIYRN